MPKELSHHSWKMPPQWTNSIGQSREYASWLDPSIGKTLHTDKTNSSLIDTTPVVPYCRVLTLALYLHTAWGAFRDV